jgi:hypothetical protein
VRVAFTALEIEELGSQPSGSSPPCGRFHFTSQTEKKLKTKNIEKNTMKKILLTTIGLAALSLAGGYGQVVLNSLGTYTQNFTGFTAFDAASHPMGWSTVHGGTGGNTYRGFTSNGTSVAIAGTSGGSITSGGVFSWGEELPGPAVGNSTFAWQGTGSTPDMVTTVSFLNSTGSTITSINLSFDVIQWRQGAGGTLGGRDSTLDLSGSDNVTGLNAFNFTATPAGIGNSAVGRAFGDSAPAVFTADASFNQTNLTGLNIANGDSFSFSFTYNRGTVGGGSAQGIAMDNFSLTAIPEPGTWALITIGLSVVLLRRKMGALKA